MSGISPKNMTDRPVFEDRDGHRNFRAASIERRERRGGQTIVGHPPYDGAFRTNRTRKTLPHGLLFVLRHPPLGKDFLDAQFSHKPSPLWLKFSGYILNRNVHELHCHSLLCVCEIVVSTR